MTVLRFTMATVAFAWLAAGVVAADRQPAVHESHDRVVTLAERVGVASPVADAPTADAMPAAAAQSAAGTVVYTPIGRAWHNQAVPGGGLLSTLAFMNPTIINAQGQIAFIASVTGVSRNQGVFVADAAGLHPIAIGCGGGGGAGDAPTTCGDVTPVGGTFGGFFQGTMFAPPLTDAGDVLFLAEVDGGSESRCLFLYEAAEDDIVPVACVGDTAPGGGTFSAVGPGSMNNHRQVVFLAFVGGNLFTSHAFLWDDGVLTRYVGAGDAAPGGGTFSQVGTEYLGYADGTNIPTGDVPDINDAGQISFRAAVSGGIGSGGIFLSEGGVHEWYVELGDPTPLGGTYIGLEAPLLNEAGEVAFFADIQISAVEFNSAWIVGRPGDWRKALAFYDEIAGGQCWGMAISRNPINALGEDGSLAVWSNILNPDNTETDYMLVSRPDGTLDTVAVQGTATPLGGTFGEMQAWPAQSRLGVATVSGFTPGAPGGILNAHFIGVPPNLGDADIDGDIDLADHAAFVDCLAGPGATPDPQDLTPAECLAAFDGEPDGDVDTADWQAVQATYTGGVE